MDDYRWWLALHVAAGAFALASFWVVAAMKKGTPRHRRVGQAYLLSMLMVLASGVPLTIALLQRGQPVTSAFLGFLLLITGNACWSAWRAIRDRQHRERYFGATYWILAILVGVSGVGVIVLGVRNESLLFQVLGAVGVIGFADAVARYRRAPRDPKWWLREHYGAMIGNGVATHIAFFGIGLRNALPGVDQAIVQNVAWFGPLAVAIVASVWLERKYGGTKPRARLPQA